MKRFLGLLLLTSLLCADEAQVVHQIHDWISHKKPAKIKRIAGNGVLFFNPVSKKPFGSAFDSKLEFNSPMNGILLKVNYKFDQGGEPYFHSGAFLTKEKGYRCGYIAEVGMKNIANTGAFVKYSLVDWQRVLAPYINSQMVVGYDIPRKNVSLYVAGLQNLASEQSDQNYAVYIGTSLGKAKKQGDLSVDVNYQAVGSKAIPSFDARGMHVARGRVKKLLKDRSKLLGKANFKGYQVKSLYLITDKVKLQNTLEWAVDLHPQKVQKIAFNQYELELVIPF
ncbi:MAG: hypothetical protein MRY21_00750 [Simkaniaceae bacterium]|nr:hypothetical protein [Simkaniaceae bacterium]